ncbi:DUF1918 domain-containing protein [Smaragdicoccus niigatensis]|uniref:DUF1918 domain-containing protein n=1 Tax=Smaragdicoccus niigatensis TaxID=359359 RepID=UPI00047588A3|nr:DUF1918 domain-containing protein [Smaragdicoccus niigatensis]
MRAKPGDWLVVESRSDGEHSRRALIQEVHSADGSPPYVIRWTDSGHEVLMFPGPDSHVVTKEELERQEAEAVARAAAVQAEIAARRAHR